MKLKTLIEELKKIENNLVSEGKSSEDVDVCVFDDFDSTYNACIAVNFEPEEDEVWII